jgi:hypothetical protein
MKNLALTVLPLLAFTASFADMAEARPSTLAEQRGYENCRAQFAAASSGLATNRHYFVDRSAQTPRFFINGARWENGERTLARMTCVTTPTGGRVLASEVESGRFQNRHPKVTVEVAGRGE